MATCSLANRYVEHIRDSCTKQLRLIGCCSGEEGEEGGEEADEMDEGELGEMESGEGDSDLDEGEYEDEDEDDLTQAEKDARALDKFKWVLCIQQRFQVADACAVGKHKCGALAGLHAGMSDHGYASNATSMPLALSTYADVISPQPLS
jgi:hypothetical protein